MAALGASCVGVVAVLVERQLAGVHSIAAGTYTGKLLEFHLAILAGSLMRADIYGYQAGDAVLLTAIDAAERNWNGIVAVMFPAARPERRPGGRDHLRSGRTSAQAAFNIVLLDFVQA